MITLVKSSLHVYGILSLHVSDATSPDKYNLLTYISNSLWVMDIFQLHNPHLLLSFDDLTSLMALYIWELSIFKL